MLQHDKTQELIWSSNQLQVPKASHRRRYLSFFNPLFQLLQRIGLRKKRRQRPLYSVFIEKKIRQNLKNHNVLKTSTALKETQSERRSFQQMNIDKKIQFLQKCVHSVETLYNGSIISKINRRIFPNVEKYIEPDELCIKLQSLLFYNDESNTFSSAQKQLWVEETWGALRVYYWTYHALKDLCPSLGDACIDAPQLGLTYLFLLWYLFLCPPPSRNKRSPDQTKLREVCFEKYIYIFFFLDSVTIDQQTKGLRQKHNLKGMSA